MPHMLCVKIKLCEFEIFLSLCFWRYGAEMARAEDDVPIFTKTLMCEDWCRHAKSERARKLKGACHVN